MKLICDPAGIVSRLRPGAGIRAIREAGFEYSIYSAPVVCEPGELGSIARKNFLREHDVYITEHPESLGPVMESAFLNHASASDLKLTVAMAPYFDADTGSGREDTALTARLAKEMLVAAISAGCEKLIVRPLQSGTDISGEWEENRSFFLELASTADSMDSDIKLLLVNCGRDINGHIVRGVCSDPGQALIWVDELNRSSAHRRFGFCIDIGTATLCGQDLYETITPLGDRLMSVILRDCDGIHDAAMLPFTACAGGRPTDLLGMVRGLRRIRFDGDLIISFGDTYSSFDSPLRNSVLKMAYETGEHFMWHIGMERLLGRYEKRVLFGAGNMCRAYMKDYGRDYPPMFTCDNNSSRWGESFCGLTVENPDKLKELPEDAAVFICNIYYDEIEAQLRSMGVTNPIERFSDEYMDTFYMDRLKMASDRDMTGSSSSADGPGGTPS